MNPRIKLLLGLGLTTVIIGGSAFLFKQGNSQSNEIERNSISELPKGKEGDRIEAQCLPPRGQYRETVAKVGELTLVAFELDFSQPAPGISKVYPKGVTALPAGQQKDMHKHGSKAKTYYHPNMGISIMEIDPLSGCNAVIKDMRVEPLPQSWPEKQRVSLSKIYWAYTGKELATKHDVSLQEWVSHKTSDPGPNVLTLNDDDIKALTALKVKLQPWHDLKLSEAERLRLYFRHAAKAFPPPSQP